MGKCTKGERWGVYVFLTGQEVYQGTGKTFIANLTVANTCMHAYDNENQPYSFVFSIFKFDSR